MSSVVKDEESDKSEVEQGTVPSDTSDSAKPSFAITNAENSTVELDIATPNNNNKCMVSLNSENKWFNLIFQVEEFNVRFLNTGVNSDWEERTLSAEDEKVIDDFPGVADSSMRLEVRIKYSDGNFSPWKSSAEPEVSRDMASQFAQRTGETYSS